MGNVLRAGHATVGLFQGMKSTACFCIPRHIFISRLRYDTVVRRYKGQGINSCGAVRTRHTELCSFSGIIQSARDEKFGNVCQCRAVSLHIPLIFPISTSSQYWALFDDEPSSGEVSPIENAVKPISRHEINADNDDRKDLNRILKKSQHIMMR